MLLFADGIQFALRPSHLAFVKVFGQVGLEFLTHIVDFADEVAFVGYRKLEGAARRTSLVFRPFLIFQVFLGRDLHDRAETRRGALPGEVRYASSFFSSASGKVIVARFTTYSLAAPLNRLVKPVCDEAARVSRRAVFRQLHKA